MFDKSAANPKLIGSLAGGAAGSALFWVGLSLEGQNYVLASFQGLCAICWLLVCITWFRRKPPPVKSAMVEPSKPGPRSDDKN